MKHFVPVNGKRKDLLKDAATLSHVQSTPALVWTINHRLGKYPSVTVVDNSGNVLIGGLTYVDRNTVQFYSATPIAGIAYVN